MIKRCLCLTSLVLLTVFLSGCGASGWFEKDGPPPLEGERISVMQMQKNLEPDNPVLESQGLLAPAEWNNEFWPQVGGYPNHSMQNLSLPASPLKRLWSANIGDGATDELPLITQPIIIDNRIFTLDTDNRLSAFNIENGKKLWDTDVQAENEDDPVIAGGIAFSGSMLYVTNGYNEVLAVKPDDGQIIWRKTIPAPSRAAPTIMEERVFVTTLDGRVMALNAKDGSILWEYTGISDDATLVGAASPAANQDIVVPVFSSGEITALRIENGSIAWSDNLSNVRSFGGLSTISDIRALPVMDKGVVFAISFSGRLVAIDERTGTRIWQREISGSQTPWMAGNHIFVLSSENQLIALGRENGSIRWTTELPRFEDDDPQVFNGPVLAGGRLILAGTDGRVIEIAPENGKILGEWDAGATVSTSPVIAGGTLYLLTNDGTLTAYR
ncbi:MAG TPA: PQQ-binding-like beta-propeller repeat protein [Alphaproteobacteria bacterium]|nr:PQQ-binding-like beta-propeller repeat protein [Alphaproteobacteria bacterium]USO05413.1 MAG: PQQ-binding-like beta-propeller repeat protein [Rhodospirillales bacterium]HOO82041.1 PQQ-binding-like beta-propeller repeat protein [Alphaproteobacteria bacterium]